MAKDQGALTGSTPPSFPENNNYTVTDGGWKPNQGAHDATGGPGTVSGFGGIGSSVQSANGLKWYNPSFSAGGKGYEDPNFYFCFHGIKENFPPIENWMNYNDMFVLNQQTTLVNFDSGPEQGAIYDAIVQVSQEAKVDARFILAVIMQEVSHFSSSRLAPPPTVTDMTPSPAVMSA